MVVAMVSVHLQNGFLAADNGVELPLLYAVGALALAFSGPGALSIDAPVSVAALAEPNVVGAIVVVGIVGAPGVLATRRTAQAAPQAQEG